MAMPSSLQFVETASDLSAIPLSSCASINAIMVLSSGLVTFYRFDPVASAPDDGRDIIAPADAGTSPGRWLISGYSFAKRGGVTLDGRLSLGAPNGATQTNGFSHGMEVTLSDADPYLSAVNAYGSSSTDLHFNKFRGTPGAPQAAENGDRIVVIAGRAGFDTSGNVTGSSAAILASLVEDAADAYTPCKWSFEGTKSTGTRVRTPWVNLQEGNFDCGVGGLSGFRGCFRGEGSQYVFGVDASSGVSLFYSGRANHDVFTGENTDTPACLYVRKLDNGRSINCAGTVNTVGADYAEIEELAADCASVQPGQIIGFDRDGRVTDRWSNSNSFGIVSTNPAFIGGDCFGEGSRTAIVAYCGKVPVNVNGAKARRYIVAVRSGDAILGKAVLFALWRPVIGRVRRVLPNGLPEITVTVG